MMAARTYAEDALSASIGFIEVKSQKGVLSSEQREIRDHLQKCGIPWAVARSAEDARVILQAWRIETRESGQLAA
jgi:VRR-NUC domain